MARKKVIRHSSWSLQKKDYDLPLSIVRGSIYGGLIGFTCALMRSIATRCDIAGSSNYYQEDARLKLFFILIGCFFGAVLGLMAISMSGRDTEQMAYMTPKPKH
jgi:hypothetical protein